MNSLSKKHAIGSDHSVVSEQLDTGIGSISPSERQKLKLIMTAILENSTERESLITAIAECVINLDSITMEPTVAYEVTS